MIEARNKPYFLKTNSYEFIYLYEKAGFQILKS